MKIKALSLLILGGFFIISGIMAAKFKVPSHSDAGTYWYYGVVWGGYIAVVAGSLAILVAFMLAVRYMIHQHLRYHGYAAWRDLERRTRSHTSITRNRVGGGR